MQRIKDTSLVVSVWWQTCWGRWHSPAQVCVWLGDITVA